MAPRSEDQDPPPGTRAPSLSNEEAARAPPGVPRLLQPGMEIELGGTRYELLRLVGRGGMAEVFLARRHGDSGFVRDVALKVITADLEEDEAFRKMFMAETQLASRLRHRGIPEAYDLHDLSGRLCLVLEYVDGVSARKLIQAAGRWRKPLSDGLSCHISANVADALHYAHGVKGDEGRPLGIVHRDVTPANVMVARSGDVKLLDFGVAYARLKGRERTETGLQKGTSAYLSPEQAQGELLDGRSDLFSLGVVLLEMLTGERVFSAETDQATIRNIIECRPEDVKRVTARVAPPLRGICERALAKDRGDRFQNGVEFSRALRGYLLDSRLLYTEEDCAAEVRALVATGPDGAEAPRVTQVTENVSRGALQTAFGKKQAPGRSSRAKRIALVLTLAALGGLAVGARQAWKWRVASGPPPSANVARTPGATEELRPSVAQEPVPARPSPPEPAAAPAPREEEHLAPAPGSADQSSPLTDARAVPAIPEVRPSGAAEPELSAAVSHPVTPVEPVVRPKKRKVKAALAETVPVEPTEAAKPPTPAPRPMVRIETLARGTLIPARLTVPLDALATGPAAAVVTEAVPAEGGDVPAGSAIRCVSRVAREGRVGIICDAINGDDRTWSFSGFGIGEGSRAGLTVVDRRVPSGTPFVVYVSAAGLR